MDEDAFGSVALERTFCKPLGFRAGFHGSQKRQRISATSRFGKQTDFQCAQSVRKAPYHLIIASPTDNLVPAAIGEFGAAVDAESERHAEITHGRAYNTH